MTDLLALAAEADREADAIFDAIDAARDGSDALRPIGFEGQAERASDLRRRARALRAEAAEMQSAAPSPSSQPAPAAASPGLAPPKPIAPVETVESVATRIINSDVSGSVAGEVLSSVPPAAADSVDATVARILKA